MRDTEESSKHPEEEELVLHAHPSKVVRLLISASTTVPALLELDGLLETFKASHR